MSELLATFIFFFSVIDPIGTVPVFIAVTSQYNEKLKKKIAIKAALVSAAILLFFVIAGELILTAIDIPLTAFQIAGGIILFLFALTMIFGDSKPEQEISQCEKSQNSDAAIFPLSIPSIASPGAILAAVLMTENHKYNLWEQTQTSLVMLSVLVITLVLMLLATRVHRLIGDGGASIISRVMGLILASVATNSVLEGIQAYFSIDVAW